MSEQGAPQVIRFVVLGSPVAQGNHRVARFGNHSKIYDAAKGLDAWRAQVGMTAQQYAPAEPLTGAIFLSIDFFLPVPKSAPKRRRLAAVKRPDASKLARSVEDALTGVMFSDDSQIVRLVVTKNLAYSAPVGCVITIEEWPASEELAEEHPKKDPAREPMSDSGAGDAVPGNRLHRGAATTSSGGHGQTVADDMVEAGSAEERGRATPVPGLRPTPRDLKPRCVPCQAGGAQRCELKGCFCPCIGEQRFHRREARA